MESVVRRFRAGATILLAAASLPVVALMQPDGAAAFGSLASSDGSSTHETITRQAMANLQREFFGIPTPNNMMKKAVREISLANRQVDAFELLSTAAHFLDEDFVGGQQRLVTLSNRVVVALRENKPQLARLYLGQALHAVQDFYAHSNWVELLRLQPNASLGQIDPRTGRAAVLADVAGRREATCEAVDMGELITRKLTSGYYRIFTLPIPRNKCRHGGVGDQSLGTGGISKDSLSSPHYSFHVEAADQARQGTELFVRGLRRKLTLPQLESLFGVGPTLAVVIDTTGSMVSAFREIKSGVASLVDSRRGTDEEPSNYVLVAFNDPGISVINTTDPEEFKSAVAQLPANGGGDCPEPSIAAMIRAVAEVRPRSDVFLYTDAQEKDSELAGNLRVQAQKKGVRLNVVEADTCCCVDSERVPSKREKAERGHQAGVRCKMGRIAVLNPLYQDLAASTGGQAIQAAAADAGKTTQLIDYLSRANAVTLLDANLNLAGPQTIDVPVDSAMSRVTFSASGAGTGAQTVAVNRPDGTVVQPGDQNVDFIPLGPGTSATILSVGSPPVGRWRITVAGVGQASVRVSGESSLDLVSFHFLSGDISDPEFRERGVGTLPGAPPVGRPVALDAELTEGFETAQFELRAPDSVLRQNLSLPRYGLDFLGMVALPAGPSRLYVSGRDATGAEYQRAAPSVIEPQTVLIDAPSTSDLVAGRAGKYSLTVQNLGPAGTFTMSAGDSAGFPISVTPESITLGADEAGTVEVVVTPPGDTEAGTSDDVTVLVQSSTDPAVQNSAALTLGVREPDTTAPVTEAMLHPEPNAAGWNNTDVTVTLSATDDVYGTGIKSLTYSAVGAQPIEPTTVDGTNDSIILRTEGVTTVSFFATDNDGNVEVAKTTTVRIDKTAPSLRCHISPDRIWPADERLVRVRVRITTVDRSGPGPIALIRAEANQPLAPRDVVDFTIGTESLTGRLRAVRTPPNVVRVYTLTYSGADLAGNSTPCSVQVGVRP